MVKPFNPSVEIISIVPRMSLNISLLMVPDKYGSQIRLNSVAFYYGVPAARKTPKIRILLRSRSTSSMKFSKKVFVALLEVSRVATQCRLSSETASLNYFVEI